MGIFSTTLAHSLLGLYGIWFVISDTRGVIVPVPRIHNFS